MMRLASFTPCAACGAAWYMPHKTECAVTAAEFINALACDGRATADDDPRCTKCGKPDREWRDNTPRHLSEGSRWEIECPHCGQEYTVEVDIRYFFRVSK